MEDTYLVDFGDRKKQIDITPNCFNKAVMGDCEIDPDFKEHDQTSLLGTWTRLTHKQIWLTWAFSAALKAAAKGRRCIIMMPVLHVLKWSLCFCGSLTVRSVHPDDDNQRWFHGIITDFNPGRKKPFFLDGVWWWDKSDTNWNLCTNWMTEFVHASVIPVLYNHLLYFNFIYYSVLPIFGLVFFSAGLRLVAHVART